MCFFAYLVYGHPMEKDIKGDTSGVFKMLLVSLAQVKLFTEFSFNSVAIDNFSYMFILTYRVKEMKIKLLTSRRPKQMPNVCFKLVNFVFLIMDELFIEFLSLKRRVTSFFRCLFCFDFQELPNWGRMKVLLILF